ncbi:MAG: transcription repressor NadR [Chloroflexi bacterium]|nr:transcription repressor NadR [Chloroflexota bacterium]
MRERGEAVAGGELARVFGTSRQIIVQDVALLRAAGEPIISTARGYLYLPNAGPMRPVRTVLSVKHTAQQAADELRALVNCGVRVVDVVVDHPIYGELRAPVMLETPVQVEEWLAKRRERNASILSELTGGVHSHTVEAPSGDKIECARKALRELGILARE